MREPQLGGEGFGAGGLAGAGRAADEDHPCPPLELGAHHRHLAPRRRAHTRFGLLQRQVCLHLKSRRLLRELQAEATLGLSGLGPERIFERGAAQSLLGAQRRHVRLVTLGLIRQLGS